jgi:hypothetical protein
MERGYLVAALAITMTFAGLSRGFHSLEQISLLHFQHFGAAARARCNARPASDLAAKMKARLRPRSVEEAQVLAESVPIAVQSSIAEQMSRQDAAISRCARETALREAERASREMMRAQRAVERSERIYVQPMALQISLPADFSERIHERAAARLAAGSAAMQVAAARIKLAQRQLPMVQWVDRVPQAPCRHRAAQAPQPPDPPDTESEN